MQDLQSFEDEKTDTWFADKDKKNISKKSVVIFYVIKFSVVYL